MGMSSTTQQLQRNAATRWSRCLRALASTLSVLAVVLLFAAGNRALSLTPTASSPQGAPTDGVQTNRELSREQAMVIVERRYGARVVRSDTLLQQDGWHLYVFRLLSEGGKVWTVRVDARSGAEVP